MRSAAPCASVRPVRGASIAIFLTGLTALGCQGFGDLAEGLCGEIPLGGCPTTGGGSCLDRECEAIYRCIDGQWARTAICDQADAGGAQDDAGLAEAGPDGFTCGDVTVVLDEDASGTCSEKLFYSDCPASLAASCPNSACLTGCDDFFVCSGTAWVFAAYCEEGVLTWVDGF